MPTTSKTLGSLLAVAKTHASWEALYSKRLAFVVPFRDRADHLAKFVPHLSAYFQQDKLDAGISHSIHVIEQSSDGRPFNAGKLKNVGYRLTEKTHDYVCFHDVDYLPIWADYSYPESPCRLIWNGLRHNENYQDFFGAVVMFNRADFAGVNGYSNCYVGWGFEDIDLRIRCIAAGLNVEHRDGTFQGLPHADRGRESDGRPTEEAVRNSNLFNARVADLKRTRTIPTDGLADLAFALESESMIGPNVHLHRVVI
jgi:hypothetical protein